jgi:hypothetical protein
MEERRNENLTCSHEDLRGEILALGKSIDQMHEAIFGNTELRQKGMLEKINDIYPVYVGWTGAKATIAILAGIGLSIMAIGAFLAWIKSKLLGI